MSSEWPLSSLREFFDLQAGFAFKSSSYTKDSADIRLLRGDNIAPGKVRWDGVKRWPKADVTELSKYVLEPGDVVLAMDRPWIPAGLKVARVCEDDIPCYLVQRVARLRVASKEDKDFLFALLSTPEFESYIQNATTGTAVPHISAKQILDFEFHIPPAVIRAQIGFLTAALDDRITLLRDTNATLEAIAQALFKSWFVDFDPVRAKMEGRAPEGMDEATAALFPDSVEETDLGVVPRGWGIAHIRDVVEGVYDGPHATPPEANEGPVFLGIKNLTGTGLDFSDIRHISEADWEQWTKRITPQGGDLVFSYEATLGFFALIPPDLRCCLGRRLALIRPKAHNGAGLFWFHQFIGTDFQRLLEKHTIQGATVNRIALKEFPSYLVLNPPVHLQMAFHSLVSSLWARIQANQTQAHTLSTLRDTLLPRLIAGRLRLPEALPLVEDAFT